MNAKIPQYLNKPNKIIGLDMDEFLVLANAVIMGVLLKSIWIFIVCVGLFFLYKHLKVKYPRGFLKHLPKIIGLSEFKGFPNVFIKHFRE